MGDGTSNSENTKYDVETIEILRNAAWQSFYSRRSYEWKIAISIWTALAMFTATILTGRVNMNYITVALLVGPIGLGVLYYYGKFILGMGEAHNIDRQRQYFFEDKMMDILKLKYADEIQKAIENAKSKKQGDKTEEWLLRHWSQGFQIAITTLLVLLAYISALIAAAK